MVRKPTLFPMLDIFSSNDTDPMIKNVFLVVLICLISLYCLYVSGKKFVIGWE